MAATQQQRSTPTPYTYAYNYRYAHSLSWCGVLTTATTSATGVSACSSRQPQLQRRLSAFSCPRVWQGAATTTASVAARTTALPALSLNRSARAAAAFSSSSSASAASPSSSSSSSSSTPPPPRRSSSKQQTSAMSSASNTTSSSSSSSSSSPATAGSSASSSSSLGRVHGYGHSVCAVLGGQWGDEGKGKLVDILAQRYDVIARFNGGSNAGHTLVVGGQKFAFHLLPCGLLYEDKVNVIGNGVVLHLPTLFTELDKLSKGGRWDEATERQRADKRLLISNRAHLLFDFHMQIDGAQEAQLSQHNIGTTKKGIGPCYASKATRNGIRVGELLDFDHFTQRLQRLTASLQAQFDVTIDLQQELAKYKEYRDRIQHLIVDTGFYLQRVLKDGKSVLAEGANAALLDLDHGTYPFVTSSSTTAGGVCTGLGLAPRTLTGVVGVVKAYTTRVGSGPFPTELDDATGERLRRVGGEFGTTTGRPRRCGWLDLPVVQYSHALNGYDSLNITKLDVLTGLPSIKIATSYTLNGRTLPAGYMPATLQELAAVQVVYEELPGWSEDLSQCRTIEQLPQNAKSYLARIEQLTSVPVSWVGVGAGRENMATAQL